MVNFGPLAAEIGPVAWGTGPISAASGPKFTILYGGDMQVLQI